MKYPIPNRSADALEHLGKSTNPGLLFDRFIPALSFAHNKEEETKWKKAGFNNVITHSADKDALNNYKARWEKVIEQAHAKSFKMKTDWRFIAGLGRKGALEVGFTFHRYGFAMLPGSSVKGVARAFAFYEIAEKLGMEGKSLAELDIALSEDDEKTYSEKISQFSPASEVNELAQNFRKVFGTTGKAGSAIFFDGIPEKPPNLELDIMNPHYPDYYGDKSGTVPPTNWQSPVPVFFLTVAAGQQFCFAVGWRGKDEHGLRGKAEEWLKHGLADLGAGGKTSAGYGYFKDVETASSRDMELPAVKQPVEIPPGYQRGVVKNFIDTYGFIQPDAGGKDIFVHANDLAPGVDALRTGQRVIYKPGPGKKKGQLQAFDVRLAE